MSDTSTRSGMLWEVERILDECKQLGNLPQILLMENVPQVHSQENTKDFNKWQLKLEQLGYKNYWEDLIATDYGVPQTRNRTFMISILGNYNYNFPNKIPLEIKLQDMLEDNVDEKYYLSDKMLNCFLNPSESGKKFGRTQQFLNNLNKDCAATITTLAGQRATDNYICDSDLRIRKLTPFECFSLMGVKKEDYLKCAKNQSDASLFHLAGDSIVLNVLIAIFKQLL